MPKVAQDTLIEFGREMARARGLRGWTLKELGNAAGNKGKSFLSDIEKGKRQISPPTVGLLIQALNLDDRWIDRFLGSETTPETEVSEDDARTDRIIDEADKSGDFARLREVGITEQAIIELAQRIAGDTEDLGQAWRELQNAMDIAVDFQHDGRTKSNHPDFVGEVLARAAELAAEGEYDGAWETIQAALTEDEDTFQARKLRLLTEAERVAVLDRNPERAAIAIIAKADLEAGGRATVQRLRAIQVEYDTHGLDKGVLLYQRLAVALSKKTLPRANTTDERGTILNDIGIAQTNLGKLESSIARLEEAVDAFRAALKERARDRVPLKWATTQNNLGAALKSIGERESSDARLEEAISAFRNALKERSRERIPLEWAATQNNLASVLLTLGQRETGTARLEEAVNACQSALKVWTRGRAPRDWAMTQNNLGNALSNLGQRETGTARLEESVTAYQNALKERTQDRLPLDWAMTQNNLGTALATLGKRETGTARLEEAVTAYQNAMKEQSRNRVPLNWAMTHGNLTTVELAFFDKTGDPKHLTAARNYLANAMEVFQEAGATHYVAMAENIAAAIDARAETSTGL